MEHVHRFKRLNLDSDPVALGADEYTYMKNGAPLMGVDGHDWAVGHVFGNTEVVNSDLPSGTNTVIGRCEDLVNTRVFFAIHNSSNNHTIYVLNSNLTFQRVMRTSLFAWTSSMFVDMDIVDDILILTDNTNEIIKINVTKAIAGVTYTPLATEITLIKPGPRLPLTWALGYDNTTDNNFLFGNYFQFLYRYVYEDYDYSVFSPISLACNSWALPPDTAVRLVSAQGNITLSGNPTLDGKVVNNGDRILVASQTNPVQNGIYVAAAGAWSRAADFPAGTTSDRTVYVTDGLKHYFKTVWRISSLNPGTIASYGRMLQGPNFITVTRPATPTATVIGIEYAVRINGTNEVIVYKSEKVGSFTASHTFYNNSYLFTVPDSESFIWFDNVPRTSKSLRIFKNRVFLFNNKEGYTFASTQQVGLTLSLLPAPATPPTTRFYNAAKPGGRYNVGLVFTDGPGGRTSDVSCIQSISIPDKYSLHYEIVVNTAAITPPAWATHFSIVSTKSLTESRFLSQFCADIWHYKKDENGAYVYSKTLTSFDAEGSLIDIGPLARVSRGYTFNAGDRIKLFDLKFVSSPDEISTIIDVEIKGQDGRFVLTRVLNDVLLDTARSDNMPFEIYTPKFGTIEPYYEIGKTFAIAALTFSSPFTLEGDTEITEEIIYQDTSAYNNTDPYANSYEPGTSSLGIVRKMNAWDQSFNTWVTNSGRSLIATETRELNKTNNVRFGQRYIKDANFLGLNTFFAVDEYEIPIENGPGFKLQDSDNVLVAICQNETTAIYVGEAFINLATGSEFLAKTDNVIGDDRKYLGGFGTLHPESVCEYSGRVYYYDMTKGVIVRRSNDGLTAISDVFGIGSYIRKFSRDNFANRATMKFHGGYDPVHHIYLLTAVSSGGSILWTIGFHEPSNGWVGFFDYAPQMYAKINGFLISFNTGKTWLHNNSSAYMNFYGVQYQRELEFSVAVRPARSVEWVGVILDADDFHTDSGSNDNVIEITNDGAGFINGGVGGQYTTIVNSELVRKSGMLRSSIKRDINTPQNYSPSIRAKFEGNPMTGSFIRVKVHANKTNTTSRMRSFAVLYNITQGDLKSVINA